MSNSLKAVVIGGSGHWTLVTEGLPADARSWRWFTAPGAPTEDMGPVLLALSSAGLTPEPWSDWRELLDREKPDLALVNPPFHLTGSITRACLERGIHVMAEKPIATEWEDLRAVRALVGRAKASMLVSTFTMRHDPPFLAGYRFVAGGGIGAVSMISVRKSYPLESWNGGARPSFYKKRSTFGGIIPWVGMHAIDLIRWYAGSEFSSVAAAQTRVGNQGHDELETSAAFHFRMASGALGAAEVDFLRRRVAPKEKDAWGDDRLRAAGDGGTLEIRGGQAWAVTAEGKRVDLVPEKAPPLFTAFVDWIRDGKPMLLTTEDCLKAAEAALHARDAAETGAVIRL